MATDISVERYGSVLAEDRSWTIHEHGHDAPDHGNIDWSLFTHANFENGLIKSGCILGRVTATGRVGPFDESASDGRNTAVGALFNIESIPADRTRKSAVAWLDHFICVPDRLPYQSGPGALTDNARADLALVIFRGNKKGA